MTALSQAPIHWLEPALEPPPQRTASQACSRPTFSIIAPVHNEEAVLGELHRRVADVMQRTGEPWELILVDDGSRDGSARMIEQLHEQDRRVLGLRLSRNFGFQVAVTAGLDHAQGAVVLLIDADLQDPPEVMLDMIAKWRDGYDVVYGVRGEREGESWFKRWSAHAFYTLIGRMTQIAIPADTGDFRLMSRRVVEAVRRMPERHRFLRGMVSWVGLKQTGVVYRRHARYAGSSKFTLAKMLRFALDAITGFSYMPLQLASYLGFAMSILSGLAIAAVIALRLLGSSTPLLGQATTLVAVLFLGGIQLICLGIIGEYLGRIYDDVKGRPLYVIDRGWGIPAGAA